MSGEPRKFPQGLWVFLIAALAGCVFGILFGVFNVLVVTKSSDVFVDIARYALGFGIGGIVTGLISGLIVTIVKKSRASS